MNNLEKVLVYWADLDQSYEKNKERLKVDNKLDYLKTLVDYNEKNNTTAVTRIKNVIQRESTNYNAEHTKLANVILEVLTGVDILLREEKVSSIDNLSEFVRCAGAKSSDIKTLGDVLPDDFFTKLLPISVPSKKKESNVVKLSLSESILGYGIVGECFKPSPNGVTMYTDSDLLNNHFIYDGPASISKIFESGVNKVFAEKVRVALLTLLQSRKIDSSALFIDNTYYSLADSMLTLHFGSELKQIKLKVSNIVDTDNGRIYVVKSKIGFENITIVCV